MPGKTNQGILNYVLLALVLLYSIYAIHEIALDKTKYQWDFRSYYSAAKAFAQGQNPYDMKLLSQYSPHPVDFNFVYPPITLYCFYPLTWFDFNNAYLLFLYSKIILLVLLFFLWGRYFLDNALDSFFFLFALICFNSPIFIDLSAGNIAIFEQLFIWLALYFYLTRKFALFCLFILIASLFKLTPLAFLVLFFFINSPKKNKYNYLFATLFLFAFLVYLPKFIQPALYHSFIQNTSELYELGRNNPTTLAFIIDTLPVIPSLRNLIPPEILEFLVYIGLVLMIVKFSYKSITKLYKAGIKDKEKYLILLFCIVYALISPRFKSYSYILLMVPGYYILTQFNQIKSNLLYLIFLLLSPFIDLPILGKLSSSFSQYYPMFLAYILWYLYLKQIDLITSQNQLSEIKT